MSAAPQQLPREGEIFLDHVGHFVRDPAAAEAALAQAGFMPTPFSVQVNPDPNGGPPRPTGTGNVCAMLACGYVEILAKTADTPLGREFDAALARFAGLHLAAFSVADAAAAYARLSGAGFRVRPLVHMRRPVETAEGSGEAAFTVARVEPGDMAEGRIQILTHHTEATVWQKRWLAHANGATGLLDLLVAAVSPFEAAERFARFLGRPAEPAPGGYAVRLDRGAVQFCAPDRIAALLPGVQFPQPPFMAAYGVAVADIDQTDAVLTRGGFNGRRTGAALVAPFPAALGIGAWVFVKRPDDLPWRA
jgi:hypothetical protein